MVIDVDQVFVIHDTRTDFSEAFETRAVHGDDTIEFPSRFRFLKRSVTIKEAVFIGDRVLVPADDFLSFISQGERQSEL
jgi:hypothetical protein